MVVFKYHMSCLCFYSQLDLSSDSRCIGLARVGSDTQCIAQGTLATLDQWEMGGPLHSLVIIGQSHPMEEKMVKYACNAKLK